MQTLVNYDELPLPVRNFISYKLTVQGRSKKTMDEYALDLRTFFRYLLAKRAKMDIRSMSEEDFCAIDKTDVDDALIASVTTQEIYDFLYYTHESRGNESTTRARKLSALKSFYKYLTVGVRTVENDPTKNI